MNSKISDSEFVEFKEEITSIIRKYVYSDCGETLESVVSNMLIDANLKISVAESCTGGLISKKLTDIPGSSSYFLGSVVAYSNELKVKSLNVKKNDIDKYGAVSKEVAIQMAQGIKENTHLGKKNENLVVPLDEIIAPRIGVKYTAEVNI